MKPRAGKIHHRQGRERQPGILPNCLFHLELYVAEHGHGLDHPGPDDLLGQRFGIRAPVLSRIGCRSFWGGRVSDHHTGDGLYRLESLVAVERLLAGARQAQLLAAGISIDVVHRLGTLIAKLVDDVAQLERVRPQPRIVGVLDVCWDQVVDLGIRIGGTLARKCASAAPSRAPVTPHL
jgi:hypothetical protein